MAAAVTLALTACSPSTPSAVVTSSTSSAAYQAAYGIGLDAYVYGLPLLVTDATFRTMTSVDVSQGAFGPVNQFNNVRAPNSASSTTVVAPGATSLSSIAWVDLRDGAAGAARPGGEGPLLRARPDRPLHREHRQPRHRQRHGSPATT